MPEQAVAPVDPWAGKTEDEILDFESLNAELCLVDYDNKEEVEGQRTLDAIRESISKPRGTHDNRHFAFTVIDLKNKGIDNLYSWLGQYPHVRELDLSTNKLVDIHTVASIPHLCSLRASKNLIDDIGFMGNPAKLQFLSFIDLSNNRIRELPALELPRLRFLDLRNNQIATCEKFNGHPTLEVLELRKNKLTSLSGLKNMRRLTELWLASNELTSISELDNLPLLAKLHLRDNKALTTLTAMSSLPSLRYLNLRDTGLTGLPTLSHLAQLGLLTKLSLQGTPMEGEGSDIKTEVLMQLQQIKFLNKDTEEITGEEKSAAREALKARLQEEEDKRKEEEERRRQEEEEARKKIEEEEDARKKELQDKEEKEQDQEEIKQGGEEDEE